MRKDFEGWHIKKQELDQIRPRWFREQEIWYVSIGVNIGFEIIGKGMEGDYSRPVLILKKHNPHTFYGLPLTSTVKEESPHYFPIMTKGRAGSILLTQGRTLSSNRLIARMIKLPDPLFTKIREAYKKQY